MVLTITTMSLFAVTVLFSGTSAGGPIPKCECAGVSNTFAKGATCSKEDTLEGMQWCYAFHNNTDCLLQHSSLDYMEDAGIGWVYCDEHAGMTDRVWQCTQEDQSWSCQKWANDTYCQQKSIYSNWMYAHCCPSCKDWFRTLVPDDECVDKKQYEDDCGRWTKQGYCNAGSYYLPWMQTNCCKSCRNGKPEDRVGVVGSGSGSGSGSGKCVDQWDYCDELGIDVCENKNFNVHCRKTCDMCETILDPEWCNHNEIEVDGFRYQAEGTDWTKGRHVSEALIKTPPEDNDEACRKFEHRYFQGAIAVISRGSCTFSLKVENVQKAGALAVIVIDIVNDKEPLRMRPYGEHNEPTIPAVSVTRNVGGQILWQLKKDKQNGITGSLICPLCRDESKDCPKYFDLGLCDKQKAQMHTKCPVTCGLCDMDIPTPHPSAKPGSDEDKMWEFLGHGRCVSTHGYRHVKTTFGGCQSQCIMDDDCTGISHTEFGNCLLWNGALSPDGGEWGDADCWRKLSPTKDFTYVGQGWCRAGEPSVDRVMCKVRNEMTFSSCMMECDLEGNKCLGFDIALENTAWGGRCHIYGKLNHGRGYWVDGWEVLRKDFKGNLLKQEITGSNGYKNYLCFKKEKSKCECTTIQKPVCANNGKTYINKCEAKCDSTVEKWTDGACEILGCECSKEFFPVCDARNDKTYNNRCLAICAGSTRLTQGRCFKDLPDVKDSFSLYKKWCESSMDKYFCTGCSGKWKRDKCLLKKRKTIKCNAIIEESVCSLAKCEWKHKGEKCVGKSQLSEK